MSGSPWPSIPAHGSPPLPSRCDVAIVGAGPAGLCAALLLARAGVEVVVLEAREQLGQGAFGRGPGLAMGWLHDHPHRLEQALGQEPAGELMGFVAAGHALAEELLGPEVWRPGEGILLPGDEREAQELQQAAVAGTGAGGRLLGPEALEVGHGLFAPWPGFARPPGALFDPRRVLAELSRQARAAGAKVISAQPVLELDDAGANPLVCTSEGALSAELVLLCAGLGGAGLDAALAPWLAPVRHCALRVEGLRGSGARGPGPWSSWYGQLRVRALPDDAWLLAGGRLEPGQEEPPPRLEAALVGMLCGQLGVASAGARVSHRWIRDAAHTRDGLPLVGPVPGRVRRILCTGFCDHDGDLAFAAAHAVCEGVLGRSHELPGCLQSRRVLGS